MESNSDKTEGDQPLEPWIEPSVEARIVALLAGEASEFEAAELERAMREEPELRLFHRRMKAVQELLAEAVAPETRAATSTSPEDSATDTWRLAPARRSALLKAIQEPTPEIEIESASDAGSDPTSGGASAAPQDPPSATECSRSSSATHDRSGSGPGGVSIRTRGLKTLLPIAAVIAILAAVVAQIHHLTTSQVGLRAPVASETAWFAPNGRGSAAAAGPEPNNSAVDDKLLAFHDFDNGVGGKPRSLRSEGLALDLKSDAAETDFREYAEGIAVEDEARFGAQLAQVEEYGWAFENSKDAIDALTDSRSVRYRQNQAETVTPESTSGVTFAEPEALVQFAPGGGPGEGGPASDANRPALVFGSGGAVGGGRAGRGGVDLDSDSNGEQTGLGSDLGVRLVPHFEPPAWGDLPELGRLFVAQAPSAEAPSSPGLPDSSVSNWTEAAGMAPEGPEAEVDRYGLDPGSSPRPYDALADLPAEPTASPSATPEQQDFSKLNSYSRAATEITVTGPSKPEQAADPFFATQEELVTETTTATAADARAALAKQERQTVTRRFSGSLKGIEDASGPDDQATDVESYNETRGQADSPAGDPSLPRLKTAFDDKLEALNKLESKVETDGEAARPVEGGDGTTLGKKFSLTEEVPPATAATTVPIVPTPEISTADEPVSTFSLHVGDVSFKLAEAALLGEGRWPDASRIRPEEFTNAFDYGDPPATAGERVSCRIDQASHPFMQQRDLLRISMRTAALGRAEGQPLRLTVLLDKSGSMERADREASVLKAMEELASRVGPADLVTVVAFARQPRLVADRLPGDRAGELVDIVRQTPSEGGTNLEEALQSAGELAKRQFLAGAQNRIVLMTDGAANLGDADPESLARAVVELRQQGIAFDACGVGADGLNDDILEALTRKGDGRYYFLNRPEDADSGFARQLAGALRPAARNVKVQVRFNPDRVAFHRLSGFERHRLNEEDFRNDAVDAAELASAEAGVAVYRIAIDPAGSGEIGEVSVRFQDMATGGMVERTWTIPHQSAPPSLPDAESSILLAGVATLFAEKLKGGPDGEAVDLEELARLGPRLRQAFPADTRVSRLVEMIDKARTLTQ